MEIILHKKFQKELASLPKAHQERIRAVYFKLKNAGNLEDSGVDYKKLRQNYGSSYYRIRVGEYRIGVQYIHPKMIIISVLKRGDFYKRFPPQ